MKITLVQSDIVWENKAANLRRLEDMIMKIPDGTDLILLPEMFNTGFSMNTEALGESPGSYTTDWLVRISETTKAGIGGSFIVSENGSYFNRWYFVSQQNHIFHYDKRHLFSPGGEDISFTAGNERNVFTYNKLRICPSICYDLRFPVWTRCRNDYDLLINSANWPEKRRDVWLTLLKARAIENQCYVAGVNRTGTDGNGIKYCGDSVIYNPYGEVIALGTPDMESLVSGEISPAELSEFRVKFPVMKDADSFTIFY